ncbi:MAG: hypothetical protein KI793_26315, partial [Rivularia sp. (in: Bacteria)]|nr:hypothetical protein [Rivularia sp. MS3]
MLKPGLLKTLVTAGGIESLEFNGARFVEGEEVTAELGGAAVVEGEEVIGELGGAAVVEGEEVIGELGGARFVGGVDGGVVPPVDGGEGI